MIGLVGLSHQTAHVGIREKLVIPPQQAVLLFRFLKEINDIEGIFVISTCNRTEVYFEAQADDENASMLLSHLKNQILGYFGVSENFGKYFYSMHGSDATRHIFKVASGLDSMLIGEYQIVSQIKEAFHMQCSQNITGPSLTRLIQKAFETGKEVRTKTHINKGNVSVSSAAVSLTGKKLGCYSKINTLTIGAGETGSIIVQTLSKKRCPGIFVANRTRSKAESLSHLTGATVIGFNQIKDYLYTVDVVYYTTGSTELLLKKDELVEIMQHRLHKPLMVVDLCMPRNVDPEIASLENVTLLDLDKLDEVVQANFECRKSEALKAMQIIDHSVAEFDQWMGSRQLSRAIQTITESFKSIHENEAYLYKKTRNNPGEIERIVDYGDHLSSKFTRILIRQIRQITNNGRDQEKLKLVNELFHFDIKTSEAISESNIQDAGI